MSDDRKYNGWTNYETWAIALWINNDQGSQKHAIELAREAYSEAEGESRKRDAAGSLAETLKEECEAGIPDGIAGTVYGDLLQSAIDEADWYEIAESFLDDDLIKEIEDEEQEEQEPVSSGIDWAAVRAELDAMDWEPDPDDADQETRSVFLGTVFTLLPSGKFYTPFANSNVSEAEANRDEAWWEAAESEAAEHNLTIHSGEGDPCDLFASEYRSQPDTDADPSAD